VPTALTRLPLSRRRRPPADVERPATYVDSLPFFPLPAILASQADDSLLSPLLHFFTWSSALLASASASPALQRERRPRTLSPPPRPLLPPRTFLAPPPSMETSRPPRTALARTDALYVPPSFRSPAFDPVTSRSQMLIRFPPSIYSARPESASVATAALDRTRRRRTPSPRPRLLSLLPTSPERPALTSNQLACLDLSWLSSLRLYFYDG
jgi:hypothetical protein